MQRKSYPLSQGEPHNVKVLLYHRLVNNTTVDDWAHIAVIDSVFRRHIELLDKWGYTAITFNDYRLFLDGKIDLPKKPVIITFDDAYEEISSVAKPILLEYGMKAVIFVIGDLTIHESIWDKNLGPIYKLLSKEQIIELHHAGFEIGSHSLTHPRLTQISRDEAWQELLRSRMLLEILINSPVRSFAYPYGLLDKSLKQLVSEAGYSIGCASYTGPPMFGSDLLEVRRIKIINSASSLVFWLQLQPWYSILRWLQSKMKSWVRYNGMKS